MQKSSPVSVVFGFQHITAPGAMQARGLHFFGIKKFLDKTNAASGSEAAS
jgi:hypothetical protein